MRVLAVFLLMISSTCWADDFFNPPPLNPELPPWMQDPSKQQQPPQGQPTQPAPDSTTSTPAPETPTFVPSDDDGEEASPFDFEGGGGGASQDQGKDNFKLLDQAGQNRAGSDCVGWGNSFLGTKVFESESLCRNDLDQQLEEARDAINNYIDQTEKEVLRGVIRGKIARAKSKEFKLDFSSLKKSLNGASKIGCKCLE